MIRSQTIGEWLGENWTKIFLLVYGLWIFLPVGWAKPAHTLYAFYSNFCHQLPERSLFLFGNKTMYSLAEIHSVWQNTFDPLILREFVGNPEFGQTIK